MGIRPSLQNVTASFFSLKWNFSKKLIHPTSLIMTKYPKKSSIHVCIYIYMKYVSKTIAYVNTCACGVISFHPFRFDSSGSDAMPFHSWLFPAAEMAFGSTGFLRATLPLTMSDPGTHQKQALKLKNRRTGENQPTFVIPLRVGTQSCLHRLKLLVLDSSCRVRERWSRSQLELFSLQTYSKQCN